MIEIPENLREAIVFCIDTGCSRRILIEELNQAGFLRKDASEEIDEMLKEKLLAEDRLDGNWIVVEDFMPNTAQKIRQKNCSHEYHLIEQLTEHARLERCRLCGQEEMIVE